MLRALARPLVVLLLAAGAAACDSSASTERARAGAEVVDADADARWVVGDVHRYAVDWQVDTEIELADLVDGAEGTVRMRLRGELRLRVRQGPAGPLLALAWERLDEATLDVLGGPGWEDRDDAARRLVGPEVLCELAPDGSIGAAYFDRSAPALFRHLMSGLLVHTDLRLPESDAERWEAVTPGSVGALRARYAREPGDPAAIRRELIEVADLRAVPPAVLEGARAEAEGSAESRLGADGAPESITSSESLRVLGLVDGAPRYTSSARFRLRRLDRRREPAGEVAALDGLLRQIPGDPVDDPEAAKELAARFAGALTVPAMLAELRLAGGDALPREGLMIEAVGLLRAAPERAAAVVPTFLDPSSSTATREQILDLLAAAGTSEAQAVLRTLLQSPIARADAEAFSRMIARFAFIDAPDPETVTELLAIHHEHAGDPGSPVYLGSLYALGSLGRQAAARDPIVAAPIHAVLVARLDAARSVDERLGALAGLGNFARVADLERILGALGDPDPQVRTQVAFSLRHLDDPRARGALEALLGDEDGDVAIRALLALDGLGPGADEAARLVARVEAGTIDLLADATLIAVFTRWLEREPDLEGPARRGLLAVAARSNDPLQRQQARRLAGVDAIGE
ncbi:MAG: HEAT repeat domain-containing protein [Nannocystaceae bacterium]